MGSARVPRALPIVRSGTRRGELGLPPNPTYVVFNASPIQQTTWPLSGTEISELHFDSHFAIAAGSGNAR